MTKAFALLIVTVLRHVTLLSAALFGGLLRMGWAVTRGILGVLVLLVFGLVSVNVKAAVIHAVVGDYGKDR